VEVSIDDNGTSRTILLDEGVRFAHNGGEHSVILTNLDEHGITLKIDSTPQSVHLDLGETKNVDTDGNGRNDLSISLDGVDPSAQTVSLTFEGLDERDAESAAPPFFVIAIIILVVIIFVGIGMALKARSGKRERL
jgi:hypothetical protein